MWRQLYRRAKAAGIRSADEIHLHALADVNNHQPSFLLLDLLE